MSGIVKVPSGLSSLGSERGGGGPGGCAWGGEELLAGWGEASGELVFCQDHQEKIAIACISQDGTGRTTIGQMGMIKNT